MFIPPWLLSLLIIQLLALLIWIWKMLWSKVAKIEDVQEKCPAMFHLRRSEDRALITEKIIEVTDKISQISIWQAHLEEMMDYNKAEHLEIKRIMENLVKDIKNLEKCINLLASGKDC
jgi:hypothetical protein